MGVGSSALCRTGNACALLIFAAVLQQVQADGTSHCSWLSNARSGAPACVPSTETAEKSLSALLAHAQVCLESTVASADALLLGCSTSATDGAQCRTISLPHEPGNSLCGPATVTDEAISALFLLYQAGPSCSQQPSPNTPACSAAHTALRNILHSSHLLVPAHCCEPACDQATTEIVCLATHACGPCTASAQVAATTQHRAHQRLPEASAPPRVHWSAVISPRLTTRSAQQHGRDSPLRHSTQQQRPVQRRSLSEVEESADAENDQGATAAATIAPLTSEGTPAGTPSSTAPRIADSAGGEVGASAVTPGQGRASGGGGSGGSSVELNRWATMVVAALATLGAGVLLSVLVWLLRRRKARKNGDSEDACTSRRPQGQLQSVYGEPPVLPSVVHMAPEHKGAAMATARSIHAAASRDTSNEYLLGGRMGSGNVSTAGGGAGGGSGNFTPPPGPYGNPNRSPLLPAPAVLNPSTPTFWPGGPGCGGGGHSGRRSLSRGSTGSGRAAQCELAVSTAGASTVSPSTSAGTAPTRGGLPPPHPRSFANMDGEGPAAVSAAGGPPRGRGVSAARMGTPRTRSNTLAGTSTIGSPRPPPGPGDSLQTKMDFIHFQLDSFGGNREIMYGLVLLGGGVMYRFQGGQAIVQIARNRHSGQEVAMKFFAVRPAFDAEAALYVDSGNPLGAFLPKLQALIDDAGGDLVDAYGTPMPPCIVMEKGEALDVWCSRRKPDLGQAYVVIHHIAKRLADLHAAGYAHRDLKPSNVMWLPRENRWTLIDFGCSARIGETASMGFSPVYAAPEVIQAVRAGRKEIRVTAELDAWSLGVLSMELLCGFSLLDTSGGMDLAVRQIAGEDGEMLPWEDGERSARIIGSLGALKRHILHLVSRDAARRPSMPDFCRVCNRLLHSTASVSPG